MRSAGKPLTFRSIGAHRQAVAEVRRVLRSVGTSWRLRAVRPHSACFAPSDQKIQLGPHIFAPGQALGCQLGYQMLAPHHISAPGSRLVSDALGPTAKHRSPPGPPDLRTSVASPCQRHAGNRPPSCVASRQLQPPPRKLMGSMPEHAWGKRQSADHRGSSSTTSRTSRTSATSSGWAG